VQTDEAAMLRLIKESKHVAPDLRSDESRIWESDSADEAYFPYIDPQGLCILGEERQ